METAVFLGLGYAGLLLHVLKKKVKGEALSEIAAFFTNNFKYTLVSVISVAIGILVINTTLEMTNLLAFVTGYTVDSLLNKWD